MGGAPLESATDGGDDSCCLEDKGGYNEVHE